MVTNSEITASNPAPRKLATKPKRPDGVQTFARYWAREKALDHRARAPEAYARRAWNRCAAQHATEIARLKKQIDNLAGDLAGIRFAIGCNETDKKKFHNEFHKDMNANCLNVIKSLLNMDSV